MFIHLKKSLIIPQSEHVKISEAIASLWGNENFEKPDLPKESFVRGVLMHDRGFGKVDNFDLLSMNKETRTKTLKDGIENLSDDHVSDVVSLMHIKRLIDMYPKEEMNDIYIKCLNVLEEKIKLSGFAKSEYEFADKITEIADDIAFDFSLGKDSDGEVFVYAKHERDLLRIKFEIKDNLIYMNPWPLSVDYFEGKINGYLKDGYPDKLAKEEIVFKLIK